MNSIVFQRSGKFHFGQKSCRKGITQFTERKWKKHEIILVLSMHQTIQSNDFGHKYRCLCLLSIYFAFVILCDKRRKQFHHYMLVRYLSLSDSVCSEEHFASFSAKTLFGSVFSCFGNFSNSFIELGEFSKISVHIENRIDKKLLGLISGDNQ